MFRRGSFRSCSASCLSLLYRLDTLEESFDLTESQDCGYKDCHDCNHQTNLEARWPEEKSYLVRSARNDECRQTGVCGINGNVRTIHPGLPTWIVDLADNKHCRRTRVD